MKILFFHSTSASTGGGANPYVFDILPRLRQAGHEVALVHARDSNSYFRGTGYIFDELKVVRSLTPKAKARLNAIIDDFRPDIVQCHHVPNFYVDEHLHSVVPVVRFIHDHKAYCSGENMTWRLPLQNCHKAHGQACLLRHYVCRCGSRNPLQNFLRYQRVEGFLKALRSSAHLQVLTEEMRRNLVINGIEMSKIQVLPSPVPSPIGRPSSATSNGRRMVLHVGGLLSKKGIWVAIRTLRAFPADCDLVFAGSGAESSAMEDHIKNRGLGDRVRVFSELSPEEWGQLYHQASLVIMPCLWNEPLGLVALRAMAYGKPVVAYRNGGLTEWVEDGVNGILVSLEKRNQFQEKVGALLRAPEELRRMGENARRLWQEKHRMGSHLDALLAGYQSLIKK